MDELMKLMQTNPEEGKAKLSQILKTAAEMEEMLKTYKEGLGKKSRIPLSRQRGVDKIPAFSGKEFLPFQKKLQGFAQDEPGWRNSPEVSVTQI